MQCLTFLFERQSVTKSTWPTVDNVQCARVGRSLRTSGSTRSIHTVLSSYERLCALNVLPTLRTSLTYCRLLQYFLCPYCDFVTGLENTRELEVHENNQYVGVLLIVYTYKLMPNAACIGSLMFAGCKTAAKDSEVALISANIS